MGIDCYQSTVHTRGYFEFKSVNPSQLIFPCEDNFLPLPLNQSISNLEMQNIIYSDSVEEATSQG